MSAKQHHEEADKHAQEAARHGAHYVPFLGMEVADEGGHSSGNHWPEASYNPTWVHRQDQRKHGRHARAHEAAAKELEAFEEDQCGLFNATVRASCPFADLTGARDIESGVALQFSDKVPLEAVESHVRCHFAFARTRGYEGMQGCPLYLKGLRIKRVDDSIQITADHPEVVAELRRTVRALTEGGAV